MCNTSKQSKDRLKKFDNDILLICCLQLNISCWMGKKTL